MMGMDEGLNPDLRRDGELRRDRRGRPPLPEEERRTIVLRVRLSPGERQRVLAQAARFKMTVSAFVRQRLVGGI